MANENLIIPKLIKLCQKSLKSRKMSSQAINVTMLAFYSEKPLFKIEEKMKAAELIHKSLPRFDAAYCEFRRQMNEYNRQTALMSRSGLQFLMDEFKDDDETYAKLKLIFNYPSVKSIEEYIEDTVDMEQEYSSPYDMDKNKMPKSHYWWFFEESE